MINQVRTLLLNQNSSNAPGPNYPGEEYVPVGYAAQQLPNALQTVWSVLFGVSPDRALLNWRLRAYMGILHASQLAEYVYALDPRVTYLPFKDDLLYLAAEGASFAQLVNSGQTLTWASSIYPAQYGNRILLQYGLTVTSNSQVEITYYSNSSGTVTTVPQSYSVNSGLSSPVALPGSSLAVQFTAGTGSVWNIQALARPTVGIPEVLAECLASLTSQQLNAVFNNSATSQIPTFQNLWEQEDQLPYRLGGLIIALAYSINNL